MCADFCHKELSGVHKAGKYKVVLFRNIAELSAVLGLYEDRFVIKLVFFPYKGQPVIDPDFLKYTLILKV